MEKREYEVEITFTFPGKFFVCAKNEDEARKLVAEKCWKYQSRACTTLPQNKLNGQFAIVGWVFPAVSGRRNVIKNVTLSDRILPAMKIGTDRTKDKYCYEVEVRYDRSGTFHVFAACEDEAKQLVEKYCKLRNPVYRSSLPPDEVAWNFPRKDIKKIIGRITAVNK